MRGGKTRCSPRPLWHVVVCTYIAIVIASLQEEFSYSAEDLHRIPRSRASNLHFYYLGRERKRRVASRYLSVRVGVVAVFRLHHPVGEEGRPRPASSFQQLSKSQLEVGRRHRSRCHGGAQGVGPRSSACQYHPNGTRAGEQCKLSRRTQRTAQPDCKQIHCCRWVKWESSAHRPGSGHR
jgi:hypothetical protein